MLGTGKMRGRIWDFKVLRFRVWAPVFAESHNAIPHDVPLLLGCPIACPLHIEETCLTSSIGSTNQTPNPHSAQGTSKNDGIAQDGDRVSRYVCMYQSGLGRGQGTKNETLALQEAFDMLYLAAQPGLTTCHRPFGVPVLPPRSTSA